MAVIKGRRRIRKSRLVELWIANILLQLQKAPRLEDEDQVSFAEVNNFYVNSAPTPDVDFIKRLDPASAGLNRLFSLNSDFFEKVSPGFYLPLLSKLSWDTRSLFLSCTSFEIKQREQIIQQIIVRSGCFKMCNGKFQLDDFLLRSRYNINHLNHPYRECKQELDALYTLNAKDPEEVKKFG